MCVCGGVILDMCVGLYMRREDRAGLPCGCVCVCALIYMHSTHVVHAGTVASVRFL